MESHAIHLHRLLSVTCNITHVYLVDTKVFYLGHELRMIGCRNGRAPSFLSGVYYNFRRMIINNH